MSYWIVVVDDEPISLANAKNLLVEQDMKVSCLRSGKDLMRFIKNNTPDLILLDILMPEMDGFETYRALRQHEENTGMAKTPVIFLTGESNSETERRGLKAGASDYIRKPFDKDIFIKRINNTLMNSKMIESLTEEATIDKLTGFLNKSSGTDRISQLIKTRAGALVVFDLDSFKLVNDLYGHDMGDRILVAFSGIVRNNIRAEDVVSRIGGDEFMAFFVDVDEEEAISSLTNRLNEQLVREAEALMGGDCGIPLGISVGAVFASDQNNDYQILFQYADSALYKVKQNGKHGYAIYDRGSEDEAGEVDLENELLRVTKIVEERGEGKGAMLLGREAFSWNYRLIIRLIKRYRTVAGRILFSVESDKKDVIFSEIVAEFGNVLKNSLRKSDIIFQSKQNQFFVVLLQLTQKDTPKVIERVMKNWEKSGYHDRVKIDHVTGALTADDERKQRKE
ncbi:MAG: diguanylate cyclase [Lachnospiraceae bacterium]|nr:diguanylate cyclase [Lachnospiraceae bacterium]